MRAPFKEAAEDFRIYAGVGEALKLNEPLATAYYMKDDLRRV